MKKWYALNQNGDMQYVGEFVDFCSADESLEYSVVWLVDEETARTWLAQLQESLGYTNKANLEGWQVSTCDEYLYATHTGAPGQIHITAEAEGFVVDIWSSDDEPVCVATTSAMYSELEPE